MAMIMYAIALTGLNLVILTTLLSVYTHNFLRMKASINLGLMIFAAVFVIQKIVTLYLFISMMKLDSLIGGPMVILEILEVLAFSSLLWITVR